MCHSCRRSHELVRVVVQICNIPNMFYIKDAFSTAILQAKCAILNQIAKNGSFGIVFLKICDLKTLKIRVFK